MTSIKKVALSIFEKAFGPDTTIRQKFFNIVYIFAFLGGLSGAIACMQLNSSREAIMVSLTMTVVFPIIGLFGLYSKKHQEMLLEIGVLAINFFVFPALYLTGGAIECGIPAYMVIGLTFSLFLLDKHGIIIAIIQSIFYCGIYYISYAYPEWTITVPAFSTALGERTFFYQAVISNTLMTTLILGAMAKIMFNVFLKENRLVKSSIVEIERQSTIDPLTNIYNRRHMYKYLTAQVQIAKEQHTSLSLAMFDIDKFKVLNDTYGHLLGDDVLKAIARIIKNSCRENEIVARYGGEEFILIMPGVDCDSAFERADEIRDCIAKSYLSPELPKDRPVTISGGVSTFKEGFDEEKLVAVADENLYHSKETGRNKITK